jgi:hypothetical protein
MKKRTKVPFLVTAKDEPNIGVVIFPFTTDGKYDVQINKDLLKTVLAEHFDSEVEIKEVQEESQSPFSYRAIVDIDDGCNSTDQIFVYLTETWIYE